MTDPLIPLALLSALGLWLLARHPRMTAWIEAGVRRVFGARKRAIDVMIPVKPKRKSP